MSISDYILTVGLEIHAELQTKTKMFCNSKNDPDESRPNVNICPVCMGHPGTLPVINREAVKQVLRVGVAVEGELADFTEFDRKNYFYPDIPKGYQISQYKHPLVTGGTLNGVAITRVHLEEDTATSIHESGITNHESSLVDFNRAGVPLMELVTEPVIHDAKTAGDFARELQLLLRYLGASDANMEKGEMRVEANVSVARATDTTDIRGLHADSRRKEIPRNSMLSQRDSAVPLGTKVEIKNLNSFRSVERAITYELERQTNLLEAGEQVMQETRGWNEMKQQTYQQRTKEDAHDYRYFPDPDLPKLILSEIPEFSREVLKKSLPELPQKKFARYEKDYDMAKESISLFIEYPKLADFFETTSAILKNKESVELAQNYLTSDLLGLVKGSGEGSIEATIASLHFSPQEFASLIGMIRNKKVSSRGAKDILDVMYREGGNPNFIADKRGLMQKSDEGEIKKVVAAILEGNAKVVSDYKAGKESALQFLIGQGMKATKGAANPELLKKIIQETISR